jgi:oligo-1,6-glucosidase
MTKSWWKESIVYQVYPRSFKDSNADGIGDLRGIIQQLDYIQSLGIDAVWLNPIFKSPNDDGGYDISDYYSIQPEFGTMQDFDELLQGLHQRGLKLIMDLVLNHSSDEHPWFQESKKSITNPYRDFYFWRPGKGLNPPNNWPSFFGGSAWQLDEATGEYYLHLFSKKQPDLNWENPVLRQEIFKLMDFWLKKGVDGLRLDVISAISKRTEFPDTDTHDFNETIGKYYSNGPRLREFIAETKRNVLVRYPNVMTVGEGPGITPLNALDYLDEKEGLNMIFHFGHMFMDQGAGGRFDPIPWTMNDFKQVFKTWDDAFELKGWGSIFLGNHDFARMVSRWGNDQAHWEKSSKLLITLLLSMRGTTFIYQGDEIGMTNTMLRSVAESKDIETQNGWSEASKLGMPEAEFIRRVNYSGRDNARTPMQWNDEYNAGFTSGIPWMPINSNNHKINVKAQEREQDSILSYFKEMAQLKKKNHALTYGSYNMLTDTPDRLFAYYRQEGKEKFLVMLNFSEENLNFPIPLTGKRVIGNYPDTSLHLRAWEALIYKL